MNASAKQLQVASFLERADIRLNGQSAHDIQVHDPAFYSSVLSSGVMGFAESYMDGFWDAQAPDALITMLLKSNNTYRSTHWLAFFHGWLLSSVSNRQKLRRAFKVAEKHYDLGNDLYTKMLDDTLSYSCAYWSDDSYDLKQAQQAKLDLVCRKLCLKPGMHVLDIGCGWGGFARYAAENYGVKVTGITVSKEQLALAKEKCLGLDVQFILQDYRSLQGQYDAVCSIGMFEHVGRKNYAEFMRVAKRCLSPSGLFLLHTIVGDKRSAGTSPWLEKYIFPNGEIPRQSKLVEHVEKSFVIEDVHNIGPHYDKTLMSWHQRFIDSWGSLSDKYDTRFYRMWRFYLFSCAAVFRARYLQVWQVLLSHNGKEKGLPLLR